MKTCKNMAIKSMIVNAINDSFGKEKKLKLS